MTILSASWHAVPSHQHRGWQYDPEPYYDPDTYTQILHYAVSPAGNRHRLPLSAYREIDLQAFAAMIDALELRYPAGLPR